MAEDKKDNIVEDEKDENIDDDNKDEKDDELDSKEGKESKTFTQEQVNRMMTREKKQGRNAVFNELGLDPKDKKMVAMFKAFVESQKTDEQKQNEKDVENENSLHEAEHRALVAEAKAEAMMQGLKSQYVEDAVTLILAKMTDDSDLKTMLGELKTKYPVWFGESSEDEDDKKKNIGKKGTGSSIKSNKGNDKEEKSLGERLAAQRKAGVKKSTYWG